MPVDEDFDVTLKAARGGDEAAFTTLFRATQPLLLRYLRSIAREHADDVAAETWVAVARGLRRFRGDEPRWRAWVFTIARARLVDAQRAAGRRPLVPTVVAEEALVDPQDVGASVEERAGTERVVELLRRLPPDQAEAVFLRHVAGLDVAQAAHVLHKRPGAVRVAAHRGLRRLAELLEQEQV